jgi:hypothetical protein
MPLAASALCNWLSFIADAVASIVSPATVSDERSLRAGGIGLMPFARSASL